MLRPMLVLLVALIVAVQIVRNSAVAALSDRFPGSVAAIWPAHPAVELARGMTAIGRAARDRRAVPNAAFTEIDKAAVKAPLAPEPFLVRGVAAEMAGQTDLAARAFLAAEWRDPRSLPAHYFLADIFHRRGDARRTLEQIAILARLAPHGIESLAPYLAAYAKDRSTWPQLRRLFKGDAKLETASLTALAADPANADAVMSLAQQKAGAGQPAWAPTLVNSLIRAGQYAKARAVWAAVSHVQLQAEPSLYDPAFSDASAPPPFNWMLGSSTAGLAERTPGGRLHVIFYGQEDGILAYQLLLLPPGAYRLTLDATGNASRTRALSWTVRCDGSSKPLASVPLDAAARGWTFTVPSGCAAQWLSLLGMADDVPQQTDVTLSRLQLLPERTNG